MNNKHTNIDILKRLRSETVAGSTPMITYYLPNGNIEAKSNAGDYLYKYSSAKPHAVEVVTNSNGTISTVPQTITYTPFNKAETITEGDYKLTYTYGTDQQRRKSELKLTTNDLPLTTIYYAGGYEERGLTKSLAGGLYQERGLTESLNFYRVCLE